MPTIAHVVVDGDPTKASIKVGLSGDFKDVMLEVSDRLSTEGDTVLARMGAGDAMLLAAALESAVKRLRKV